eukprot:2911545-Rhodomonas_salina.3
MAQLFNTAAMRIAGLRNRGGVAGSRCSSQHAQSEWVHPAFQGLLDLLLHVPGLKDSNGCAN